MDKIGYVYILANKKDGTLYIGVTSNLQKRIYEHKNKTLKGFSNKYNIHMLVYYEERGSIEDAINREKQLKAGNRKKKIDLIISINPERKDLYKELFIG